MTQHVTRPAAGGRSDTVGALFQAQLTALVEALRGRSVRGATQRAALFVFLLRVLSAGIAYLTQVVLARWMGSLEYGAFVFVWVWVLVLGGLSSLGLSVGMLRFLPLYRERGEHGLVRGLLLGGRLVVLVSSTVVALIGLGGLFLFGDRLAQHYVLPAYLALFCIPLYALTDVQDSIGRANRWLVTGLFPPYVLRPLLLLTAMVAAHEAGLPMTAATAAGAAIIATWAAGILQMIVIAARTQALVPAAPRQFKTGFWVRASLPMLMISGFDLVVQNIDVVMISLYMTPREVGIYFAGLKTMSLIAFVHYAVASASAHHLAALRERGDHKGLARLIQDTVTWTFWPSLVGAVLILALGRPLLALFGPEFESAHLPMAVLAVGLLIKASAGSAEFILNALGEQKRCGAVLLATALLDVGLNVLLVSRFGLMGAAFATATTLAVTAFLYRWLIWRTLGLKLSVRGVRM